MMQRRDFLKNSALAATAATVRDFSDNFCRSLRHYCSASESQQSACSANGEEKPEMGYGKRGFVYHGQIQIAERPGL